MVPSVAEACLSPGPLLSCGRFSSFVPNSSPSLLKCLYKGASHVWSSGFLMQKPLLFLAPWEAGLKMLFPSVKSWLELGWEFYKELMNIAVQYMFKSWAIPLSIRVCRRCWAAEQSGRDPGWSWKAGSQDQARVPEEGVLRHWEFHQRDWKCACPRLGGWVLGSPRAYCSADVHIFFF